MGLEDDFLLADADDEKTIEFIKNYLPQELKEKFSDDELYYFLDLIDEYYSESGILDAQPDEDGYVNIDLEEVVAYIVKEAKKDEMGIGFYQWCQGDDWERIVDMDTKALIQCAGEKLPLFTKPLCSLQVPLLLMGSEGDEMSREDFQEEYAAIAGETGAEICIFPNGSHPAILSNAKEAAKAICKFLET